MYWKHGRERGAYGVQRIKASVIEGLLCEVLGLSCVKSKQWGGSLEGFCYFVNYQMVLVKKKNKKSLQEHPKTGQLHFQLYEGSHNCVFFIW